MEKMNDLRDLLKHEIQDLYSVEEQIIEALPAMIDKARNPELKNALKEHLRITEGQKARLDQVREMLQDKNDESEGKKKGILSIFGGGKHVCKGVEGIIEEGMKVMKSDMSPEVMDAAILASAQKVEHYEICGYGTARSFARELQLQQVALLLEQTLNEEYNADDKLTMIATSRVNLEAESAGKKSGDRSASGSTGQGRSGKTERETARERVREEEPELEAVSALRATPETGKKKSTTKAGRPGTTETPRSAGTARSAAAKRTTAAKTTKKSNGRGSGESGGRGGSSRGSSRTR